MRLLFAILAGAAEPVTSFSFSSIQPGTLNQVTMVLKVDDGYDVTVNWGDGNGAQTVTANGHDQTLTSTYVTTSTTYTITISGHLGHLRKFWIGNESTVSNLNINDFATNGVGLTQLILGTLGSNITGSISNLPSTVYHLDIDTVGITGAPVNAPSGITYFQTVGIAGASGIAGAIPSSSSHADLFWLYITAGSTNSAITGSISTMPPLVRYILTTGCTGMSGSFDSLFSSCTSLTNLFMTSIGNSITGTSAAVVPSTLRQFNILAGGSNNFTFDIADFSSVLSVFMQTLGTGCTGNVESLTAITSALTLRDIGSGVTYGGGALPAWSFNITIRTGMTTTAVDNFLIAYAAVAVSGSYTIDLRSPNSARSSASDSAVSTLQGLGRTIQTA